MRYPLALRLLPLLAAAALGACVNEPATAPVPPQLAEDRERPALALIEHALGEHFAGLGTAADPPTTCVELRPGGLSAEDEQALIARFPRLAPRARCETDTPPPEDGFTGERAVLVQVYDVTCSTPEQCGGWVSRPGSPAMHYAMAYAEGAWRFTGDRRILAN